MSVLDNALQALFSMAHKEILWENASPASTFAAQEIKVADLGKYDFVGVESLMLIREPGEAGYEATKTFTAYKKNSRGLNCSFVFGDSTIRGYYRMVYIDWDNETLNITNGFVATPSSDQANNSAAIPLCVYGGNV